MNNVCEIIVRPRKFEVSPPCPIVVAAFQPLMIGIDWDHAGAAWESVTVQNFKFADGSAVQTQPSQLVFLRSQGNIVQSLSFGLQVQSDRYCKYEVVFQGAQPGDEWVFDPTVLLKRIVAGS